MKRSSHIALVAIFVLAIHSLGFCAGAAAGCTTSVCAAHQQEGSCPRHPHHSGNESRHQCCTSPICLNGVELTAGKDASMTYFSMLLPVVFNLPSVTKSPARLAALAWVHAPPLNVPLFTSIRTLLI